MNRKTKLSINQRIISVLLYLIVFFLVCVFFTGGISFISDSGSKYNLLFISSTFLLIFGIYISEPYFTKPVDVITNSSAVILTLLSIDKPNTFLGYWILLYITIVLGLSAIILIFSHNNRSSQKAQKLLFGMVVNLGQSKVIFSAVYLITTISYFQFLLPQLVFFLCFWIVFIFRLLESTISGITKGWSFLFSQNIYKEIIGEAIGCDNPFLYQVEVDYEKYYSKNVKKGELICIVMHDATACFGIIANEKQLIDKKWLTVYLLDVDNEPLRIDHSESGFHSNFKSIFKKDNSVFRIDVDSIENAKLRKAVLEHSLFKNRLNIIGYVYKGSDINRMVFYSLLDSKNPKCSLLKEGTVIKTEIYGQEVLYQIIDGNTNKENLDNHDSYGYMTAISRKLGKYNLSKFELNSIKWLPNIYTPIYFLDEVSTQNHELSIGKLPETNYEIVIKDINSLVTHNTAILGILGIGKSRLTFELMKKIIENTNIRMICMDITNEYKKTLPEYIDGNLIETEEESIFNEIDCKYEYIHKEQEEGGRATKNHLKSGNVIEYRESVKKDLMKFFFKDLEIPESKEINGKKRIRIFNPDYHKASRGEKVGFNVITTDLSQAEKTRIISEEIYRIMMKLGLKINKDARVLLVFEEAHSLVPEWKSTANEGDSKAVNGTAKVILQGRKYGLGSLVITQRTANISKSILNQCNTIFALRVFDDTGKQFLENYIGSDYSNTLANLSERHSIVVGKALKLKQPVIVRLNDMEDVMLSKESSE